MTQGKNKKVPKGKKLKKKVEHMSKKVWFDIRAPVPFTYKNCCKTIANKTVGIRTEEDNIKGRIFEVSVGDLMNDEEYGYQIVKLKVEDVKEKVGYTSFHGLRFTNDKLRSLVKKWHTQITAQVEVTTTDGYHLRVFSVAYTRRRALQTNKTTYAKKSQVKKMAAKMRDIMKKQISQVTIKELCNKLIHNLISKDISRACAGIFPLTNTFIYKVKVIKSPKVDINSLQTEIAETTETSKTETSKTKQQGEIGGEIKQ